MKAYLAAALLLSTLSANAAPIVCPFSDQEQDVMRNIIEVLTGASRSPAGGIENAQLGVYLTSKLRGQLPPGPASANCTPAPAPKPE